MAERIPSDPDITPTSVGESRRMGRRAATKFSVFLVQGAKRYRARSVDISTTGVLIDWSYNDRPVIEGLQTLELVVPGLGKPIRTLARPVRSAGKYDAFEFMSIRPVDRLSLAEHLDREKRLSNVGS